MVQRELFNSRVSLEDGRHGENSFYADRLDLGLLSVFDLVARYLEGTPVLLYRLFCFLALQSPRDRISQAFLDS